MQKTILSKNKKILNIKIKDISKKIMIIKQRYLKKD